MFSEKKPAMSNTNFKRLLDFSLGRASDIETMNELAIDSEEALFLLMAQAGLPMPKCKARSLARQPEVASMCSRIPASRSVNPDAEPCVRRVRCSTWQANQICGYARCTRRIMFFTKCLATEWICRDDTWWKLVRQNELSNGKIPWLIFRKSRK